MPQKKQPISHHIYYHGALSEAVIKLVKHPGSTAELVHRSAAACFCFLQTSLREAEAPSHRGLWHTRVLSSFICPTRVKAESPKNHQWDFQE